MAISEIPLSPENQQFSISLAGQSLQMAVTWRAVFWCLDVMDSSGADLIKGIPLITGADLLAQYAYLGLGFKLAVFCDDATQAYPTKTDLGTRSHLLVFSE